MICYSVTVLQVFLKPINTKAMRKFLIMAPVILVLLGFCFMGNLFPAPACLQTFQEKVSIKIFSRSGTLLRQTRSSNSGRQEQAELTEISPEFLALLLATEDSRFYYHPGIDPLALVRALYQNLKTGHVVSGASTITMQIARRLVPGKRNLLNKIKETFLALYLEMSVPKKILLEFYVNELCFSNELYGVAQASRVYFNKAPGDLSLSEGAYLLSIIRAPSYYNPYLRHDEIVRLREKILFQYGKFHPEISQLVQRAVSEPVIVFPLQQQFEAPHFTEAVLRNHTTGNRTIRTSLDFKWQKYLEALVLSHVQTLEKKNVSQASVLVVKNQTGEILAYVGSRDYWDDHFQGMNDGVLQKRQPGSTLKTFTYARALDLGVEPSHILPDVAQTFSSQIGDYIPENYDKRHMGPVLLRTALANSLNVPAVSLLQEIGVSELYGVLKKMQFSQLTREPSYYGLGLTLGNVETSLFELVQGYSVFGRQGYFCDLTFSYQADKELCWDSKIEPVFSKEAVQIVRGFLSDRQARVPVFGAQSPLDFDFPVMIKTGTSQKYRDNWAVAVTPDFTVGVWVGNFNAMPMKDVSGVSGAGPLIHDVVSYLFQEHAWTEWPDVVTLPKVTVCSLSGKKPTPECLHRKTEFAPLGKKLALCDVHVKGRVILPEVYAFWQKEHYPEKILPQAGDLAQASFAILRPEQNAVYHLDPHRPRQAQFLSLETTLTHENFDVYFDGALITQAEAKYLYLVPGTHHIQIIKAGGDLSQARDIWDEVKYQVR